MIGTALAIGSGLVSLYGTMKNAAANQAQDRFLDKRQTDLDNWYNKEYNTNYLDTTQGRSAIGALRTHYDDVMKKVSQGNAISGASDEAKVATGDKVQRSFADQISRIAGYGTQYKDSIRREYQGLKMNLDNLEAENLARKSANWSNLVNNAANVAGGAITADGEGAFKGWDDKITNWWKNRNGAGVSSNPLAKAMLHANADNATVKNMFN